MNKIIFCLLFLFINGCSYSQETLVGGPCEVCEAIFEYGDTELSPVDTLPGFNDAAEKLKVTGTIYQSDGKTPASGVILYIYHTNKEGIYPTQGDETGWGQRHGYIRGWVETGNDGQYTFYTQKPGSYGGGPAHIHPTILEPDGKYYYIDMYVFEDDPNLNRNGTDHNARGGSGVVKLKREGDRLVAVRNIILGKNIPGYK